jgi:hypothetical protein
VRRGEAEEVEGQEGGGGGSGRSGEQEGAWGQGWGMVFECWRADG